MSTINSSSAPAAIVLHSSEGIVTTSASASLAKSPPRATGGLDEFLRLIELAETSSREHFQQLRKCLQQSQSFESPNSKVNLSDKKSLERLLQTERDNMSRQRAQEQEQLRATMQQLAEAWQRLEQEQLVLRAKPDTPSCSRAGASEDSSTDLRVHLDHQNSAEKRTESRSSGGSLTELGFQPPQTSTVAVSANGNEEMFHKLRSDLLRRSSTKSER